MVASEARVRMASLATAGVLMSAAVFSALTMTVSLIARDAPDDLSPVVTTFSDPPPPLPPEPQANIRPPTTPDVVPEPSFEPVSDLPQTPVFDVLPQFSFAEPVEITNPRWLQRPRDLERYFPARALAQGVEGEVLLDCRVSLTGALACSVLAETPERWGFGQAALRIAADHRMEPARNGAAPVEGRYRMRVPFQLQ